MSRASFDRLENRVAAEYRAKGYSAARAERIGRATAGKTAHRKWAKHGLPKEVRDQRACVRRGLAAASYEGPAQWKRTFGEVTARCAEKARRPSRRRAG